ncbi:Bicarbonate transporter BicA [Corynebacterium occultum]|uniref:Bicarbonate transporter BicA n=1 Tax=Corynebacterium occultum TaxID=2675219 RepID=A0A6B8W494_9CORY|nr:SulP family inorganic anion transporter [Corynebacterium occultum]QGU06757.1 Bicarbonate transporter BicA [Corynebacterium occultum]
MTKVWKSFRELLPSSRDYEYLRYSWRADVTAGITVGIVALPLALAFGVSSGVGAEAGLITAIVAGLIAAIFGGSNVQVSGPTGAMVVVLAPIVMQYGIPAVAVVSIMAGVLVLLAGFLKMGRMVSYIPWPVIEGFTAGIGVIIFMQQVPAAVASDGGGNSNAVLAACHAVVSAGWPGALLPVAVVVAVAAIMLILGKVAPKIPGSFIAIVVVTVVATLFSLPLETIGTLPQSLPAPAWPEMDPAMIQALAGPAVAVAALAAIESLLSARVAASMADTGPYNADRELVGQGLASVGAGLFGGMPATGAIARTAVNVRSGARTRMSAIVHALVLLAVVYVASTVVSVIPLAALSGVLMVTAVRMISPEVIRRVTRSSWTDALVFFLTAIITVSVDLVVAVIIGIIAAAFFILRKMSLESGVYREVLPGGEEAGDSRIGLFRLEGALFFGAAERILDQILDYRDLEVVIIRLSEVQLIDTTGAHQLAEVVTTLERRGVTVLIKGVRKEHIHVLGVLGAIRSLRHPNHLFEDLGEAVAHARSHTDRVAS